MKFRLVLVLTLTSVALPAMAGSSCPGIRDADERNLCFAKTGHDPSMYCSKIRNADLNQYCIATAIRHSRAMCGFIKNKTLQERCKAELR